MIAAAEGQPELTGRQQADRDALGRFPRGKSGFPSGRPKGSKNKATALVEALVCGRAQELGEALVSRAIGGDTVALRLIVERLWPVPREAPIRLALPALAAASDAPGFIAGIIERVGAGEVLPGEAAQVLELVAGYLKATETVELAKRIGALEQRFADSSGGSDGQFG